MNLPNTFGRIELPDPIVPETVDPEPVVAWAEADYVLVRDATGALAWVRSYTAPHELTELAGG